MIRDRVKEYYIDRNMNCAEAVLHAANDEYNLGVSADSFKLIGGFGGGMGCGHVCGALSGGIAAIGQKYIEVEAHKTANLKELCTAFVKDFNDLFGTENCEELKAKYKRDDVRCLDLVVQAADALEKVIGASNA